VTYPSILLIHGGMTAAWIWNLWRERLGELGWQVNVLDLRGHGRSLPVDFSTITMEDYEADVASVTSQIAAAQGRYPIVGGWAMGGLVAMMHAALQPEVSGLLLFAPSPPLEVAGRADAEVVRATPSGPFGPEVYGLHVDDLEASREALPDLTDDEAAQLLGRVRGAEESGMARRQRRRGISVAPGVIRSPSLVVFGEQDVHFAPEIQRSLATYLAGDAISVPGVGHWGIVCHEESVKLATPRIDDWLKRML
jgi:pimeloyl-ACP methyl ester carboxylesterase